MDTSLRPKQAPLRGYRNPNLQRQGEKSRALAAERSAEKSASLDPLTYGFVSGLLGNDYGSSPLSVLDPKRAKSQTAQDIGMAIGTTLEALPVFAALRKPAAKTAKALGKSALEAVNNATLYGEGPLAQITPQVMNITRETKGGNWWPGSIERNLTGNLKKNVLNETGLKNLEERQGPEVLAAYLKQQKKDVALNNWIDKKLHKYVQNEMGTPDDPIRKMAEEGKPLHVGGENFRQEYENFRSGAPLNITATNPVARQWESLSDFVMGEPKTAKGWKEKWPVEREGTPDWLHKLPDETAIHEIEIPGANHRLEFNHLIDELHNAMNPESGLPNALRFTPEQLDKITVPQAIERVAKINEWRAEQKVAADKNLANNSAVVNFKEYGENNPKGLHWVEFKAPKEGLQIDDGLGNMSAPGYADLEKALKYEGETMGHCVGGYCDPVYEGKQRIFSLRDAKGQPHVTVEMRPAGTEKISDIKAGNAQTWEIYQVKGKGNAKPKEDYIPYVQDFVKETGVKVKYDLDNTGLTPIDNWAAGGADPKLLEAAKQKFGNYATQDQFLDFAEQFKVAPSTPAPAPPIDPFWFNSKSGAYEPMGVEDVHAQKIQDPEYAARLGVTPEQATAYPLAPEAESLITGRQTGNRLSLVGMGTPTDETLAATQRMLQEKQYAPEILDFGGGERLWENMTPEDLLKARTLEDLEPFKKYKAGGEVKISRYSKQHIARDYASRKK